MKRLNPEKTAAFQFERGPVGCLLTHGFTGSPFEMRELGEYLAGKGLTVLGKPLPGHGTSPHDMLRTNWYDWYHACVENLAELNARCEKVFLCGMSMGGTLSLHVAAHYASRYNIAGVAAYAAPLYLKNPLLPVLPVAKRFMKFKPPSESDVADPVARDRQESYDRVPLECISSLLELLAHVKHDLQDITVPVLLVQSTKDNTVHPPNVRLIHKLLGSRDKTLVEVEKSYHVVTVDYDKELVKEKTYEFIRRVGNLV
ncbi:MAG: alpha/beta fold hydrolase [Candidatus Abyssobacteria bacterium SURF_17]|uniref:Alpha/beta fold hydrolase n=1 Tax=Candidatus Abyssobacteria bacterium SURF_17 TaxID=2093361 RepID=A0A419ER50_9BACT|nr:MAG: alpha/beta fold hydrolase [Candidatus Abyssubacteria bacterium SURF_17]